MKVWVRWMSSKIRISPPVSGTEIVRIRLTDEELETAARIISLLFNTTRHAILDVLKKSRRSREYRLFTSVTDLDSRKLYMHIMTVKSFPCMYYKSSSILYTAYKAIRPVNGSFAPHSKWQPRSRSLLPPLLLVQSLESSLIVSMVKFRYIVPVLFKCRGSQVSFAIAPPKLLSSIDSKADYALHMPSLPSRTLLSYNFRSIIKLFDQSFIQGVLNEQTCIQFCRDACDVGCNF